MNNEEEIHQENLSFLRTQPRSAQAPRRRSSLSRDRFRRLFMFNDDDDPTVTDPAAGGGSGNGTGDAAGNPNRANIMPGSNLLESRRHQRQENNSRSSGASPPSNYSVPLPTFYSWLASHSSENIDLSSTDILDLWRGRLTRERDPDSGETTRSFVRIRDGNSTNGSGQPSLQQVYLSDPSAVTTADLLQTSMRRPRLSSRPRGSNMTLGNHVTEHDRALGERRGEGSHFENYRSENESYHPATTMPYVQEAIRYLDKLRVADAYNHPPEVKGRLSLVRERSSDFVRSTISIAPQASCSWLHPGLSFEGSQHATHSPRELSARHHRHHHHHGLGRRLAGHESVFSNPRRREPRINVFTTNGTVYRPSDLELATTRDEDGTSRSPDEEGSGATHNASQNTTSDRSEHWPVKVTIHDVNYTNMTLCGTMEAYNIPEKPITNQEGAHIVTFLEGEIIDFNKHSLRTKSFNANLEIDANYWHSLEPFKDMSDDEMMESILSEEYMKEKLGHNNLLMRWKERCFISPSHERQGLTISGFYYICLRRSDGHIQGMYYDDGSAPYQLLNLDPSFKNGLTSEVADGKLVSDKHILRAPFSQTSPTD
ncbi:hypothetical protein KEM54_000104 [Ascosphaera aggregata]|nr:hypothetical protein KEM54_000104 [Ascosphaera aggregata]